MKPEKVKSRWRRSSELETGEKSTVSMGVDIDKPLSVKGNEMSVSETKKSLDFEGLTEKCDLEIKSSIPNYDPLEENMYLFKRKRTKRKKEVRRMLCDCTLSEEERQKGVAGCQDECLNRLLMIECGSRCPTGEACSNKRFQKRLYAKTEPFNTEKKGWGLKLLEDVPMGNFVIEYVGEVLSTQDFKQRVKQYAREKSNHYYFMALKSDEIIDATNKGNLSRFMNHSCDPNCVTQKWTVNGELRIGFFAKRDLKAGEELTFDYQLQRYGREAQKCYCGSEICSGFIGMSNQISLEVNTNKSNSKRKKVSEEKKMEDLEDLILEEEIEKLSENGGLRNKEETLLLSRLMVRAEDRHSRENLLDIILGTSEIGCLRLFLDYHGLSLLWSWMVDITDLRLKTKILQVLSLLPVPNKTVLQDSRVYDVVERWASVGSTVLPGGDSEQSTSTNCDKNKTFSKKFCDTSDSDTPITSDLEENFINGNSEIPFRSDEESGDVPDEENNHFNNEEISVIAKNLLTSWKEMKEVFRIPRREQPRKIRLSKRFSRNKGMKQRIFCKSCQQLGIPFCTHCPNGTKYQDAWKRNKYRSNPTELEDTPRKVLLPTPQPLTKKERREQFAKQIEQCDKRKKALQDQYPEHGILSASEGYSYEKNPEYCFNINEVNSINTITGNYSYTEPINDNTSFDPYYYNSNASNLIRPALLPTPNPVENGILNVCAQPTLDPINVYKQETFYQQNVSQVPFVGATLPAISLHQSSITLPDNNHLTPSLVGIGTVNSSPLVPTIPVISREIAAPSSTIMHSSLYSSEQNFSAIPNHENYQISPLSSQYIPSQEPYVNIQNGTFYPETQYPTQQLPLQAPVEQAIPYSDTNGVVTTKTVPANLPPNWKSATDSDGNVYYYHVVTRQAQWDPPELESVEEDDADEDTPTYDEPKERKHCEKHSRRSHKKHPKKRSAATIPADTSYNKVTQEVAKKIKELFRTKMSSYVVQCLNPYHREDCRVGKITSNDDFKHLARKLTHFVMAKELKHCKKVEDLECNDNVKHKARDFIHKYMAKFGPYYKKEKYESLYV